MTTAFAAGAVIDTFGAGSPLALLQTSEPVSLYVAPATGMKDHWYPVSCQRELGDALRGTPCLAVRRDGAERVRARTTGADGELPDAVGHGGALGVCVAKRS